MSKKVYDNEKWWQENGFEWVKEIEQRREVQPLYGAQEIVLSNYLSKLPEGTKVLEFGAGFGRHANYLSDLQNIEYFAVDQSPTMLEALKGYTNHKLKDENVVLIEPRQALPFPDKYFDVVFTVSVLIHINPEHIQEIISELKRVAKHVIIHFENSEVKESKLQFQDHNGCWAHCIKQLYSNVQVYDNIVDEQAFYWVNLDKEVIYQFDINPVVVERISIMERNLAQGLKKLEGEVGWRQKELEVKETKLVELEGEVGWRQKELEVKETKLAELEGEAGWRQKELEIKETKLTELEGEVGWRQKELEVKEKQLRELEGEVGWRKQELTNKEAKLAIEESRNKQLSNKTTELEIEVNQIRSNNTLLQTQVDALNNELNAIYNSNAWKLVQKIKSNNTLRWTGKKAIGVYKRLKHTNTPNVQEANNNDASSKVKVDPVVKEFVDQINNLHQQEVLAITHKNWLGVQNSTKECFGSIVVVEELSNFEQVKQIGNAILTHNPKKVVFSGFAAGWNTLCWYIKKENKDIKTVVFWHGNTTHMYEDYSWIRYQEILQLSKEGSLDTVAFAKESMCTVYKNMGLNVAFIKNHVEKLDIDDSDVKKTCYTKGNPISIGIYSSGGTWNKNAYTQIAAASLFKNATVNMVPYNDRMNVFATQLGLQVTGFTGNISREELMKQMQQNDINFYITFSECAPLVPLESLSNGVVCLTGNNHHYFKNTALEELLVVERADDPSEIYTKAVIALENKDKILKLYNEWHKTNKVEAQKSIEEL